MIERHGHSFEQIAVSDNHLASTGATVGSTRAPRSGKCSFVCYNPVKAIIRAARRGFSLVRSLVLRNHGISADSRRFRRARDRFRFCARCDYTVVQFMPANDCNLRSIRLVKHFPPSLLFDLDFRPSSSSAALPLPFFLRLTGSASSGSLACRKVQNTRRKRAIRDRTPLTFHFSWSKIIRSPSYVPKTRVRSFR